MYLNESNQRVLTHKRPKAVKQTSPVRGPHHKLEDWLSKPWVQRLLRWMTIRDAENKCFFIRLCENYDNPELSGWQRLKWALPSWLIDRALERAGLDKELMITKLFHHPPTVRSLALTAKSIGRYGLTRPQRFTAPLMVVWNITQVCNLACEHCYQNAGPQAAKDELTLEEKLRVVDQLADNWVPFLAIAGGEPLACPDIWQVLEHAHRRGIHLTIATNGTLLTREKVERLRECGVKYIEVSVDSLDPAEHDRFRGKPGAWQRAINGIKASIEAGMRTGFATCFTRHNVDRADEIIQFAYDLGCSTFSHFNFIPVGRGKQYAEYDLTPEQRERLLRVLNKWLQSGKINVISTAPQFARTCVMYAPPDGFFATGHAGRGKGQKTRVLAQYTGGCGAGRCYCCIQPNGFVTPCVYISSVVVGDLRKQSFEEIWNNELFRVLQDREDRGDHCGVCDYRIYCGGCRARALAYTGDITAGDPGCMYNRVMWEQIEQEEELFRIEGVPA